MKKRIACLLLALVMLVGLIPVTAIRASAASITVSEAGIRVIKEYMGFHKNAYKVAENDYRIGYGTPSVAGATITEANADQLLREKLDEIIGKINASGKITATLVQKRMDALVWLSYVEGYSNWLNSSTLVSAINNSTIGSAFVDAMVTFDYDVTGFTDDAANRSVLNHRLAMANLYLYGSYSATDTGSLGYTVFDAGENATFPNGARKMVQAFVGTSVTKINVPEPNYSPVGGTVKFLGWYTGNAMITGVGAATKGSVLAAHWQKPTDEKVFASYTLPAYVIYEANGVADNQEVAIYKAPNDPVQIDVLKRDSVITVVAETSLGGQKWLQLSTGGWVKLCSDLGDVPVTISPVTVTITDDYVNIRKEPSVTATKVGTAKMGETRTIAMLSDDGKWGYCSEGWIFLAYTNYYGTSSGGSASPVSGTPGTVSGAANVNVRVAAGVGNNLATTLANGTSITVYEQTTVNGVAWGRIDQGWICMQYVTLQQSAVNSGSNISTGSSAVVSSSVSLNVRSGPGTTYSKIATLAPGTSVVILRKETVNGATWGLIDQGWINLSYVTPIGSSSAGGSSVYSVGGTVVNCSSGVNIRAAAGTSNALVGVAGVGTRVYVTEITTVNGYKWGHIDRGWVCMDYVQLDSEFKQPDTTTGNEDDKNNVVTSFQGYPAYTTVSTALLETASAHAKTLMTLSSGASVNILAWTQTGENLYGKVAVGSTSGWVNMKDVSVSDFNAKVTASKADVYEEPSTRSKFYASLVNGTYITIPAAADNANWKISDGALWGKITATVSGVTYTGWIKLSDVTMFKGNTLPTGVTTYSGAGYLTGYLSADTPVYEDENGNVTSTLSLYTLPAGSGVNVLARNYQPSTGKTFGKVTVGSVSGWIDMDNVQLDPVAMTVKTAVSAYSLVRMTDEMIAAGHRFTITGRSLVPDANEINHGVVDLGEGYLDDDTSNVFYVTLDDGKVVPTGNAAVEDPSNPVVVSSVVITGKAPAGLSIYEEAIEGSRELLKLNSDSQITVLNWKNVGGITWGKVQFNKIVGWVKINAPFVDFSGLKGAVAVDELRVYNNADTSSAVQVLRVNGKAIEVYSVYFDGTTVWGMIDVAGYSGWIDLSNVTLNTPGIDTGVDTSNLPVIAKGKINSVNATVNVDGQVTNLPKGTEVSLIDLSMTRTSGKAMWLVELGDKDGWIDMDCLTMYSSIASITDSSAPIYDDLTLSKTLYTLYRGEKATILSYYVSGGRLYGEVACDNTTGWILICDELDQMHVSLTPGSTGSGINTGSGSNSGTGATEPTTPTVEATEAYISCASTVNVRAGAGVDKPLVTTLGNGTNVKIYEQTTVLGKQWARIDQGWVCMDYVKLGTLINIPSGGNALNGGSGTATIMTSVPAGAIAVGYANQDIKIRSGSGLGYEEVGNVKKGYSIVIYENKLDGGMSWGRTDNGWVCTSYLTITGIGASGSGNMGTIGGVGFTANVRGSASSNGALMAKVMVSSRVAIHDTTTVGTETWGRTDLGWINMQYVVLDSAAAPIPGGSDTTATTPTEAGDTNVG